MIGGVVATLAGVIKVPAEWVGWIYGLHSLSWLRGVPGSFTYREDAVRHELTAQVLWNELAKYVGHAEPYNKPSEKDDTSAFLKTICLLVETELQRWSALVTNINTENQRGPPKLQSV